MISKSNEHAARVRFEITSMISDQNCTTRSSITTLLHPFRNHTIIISSLKYRILVSTNILLIQMGTKVEKFVVFEMDFSNALIIHKPKTKEITTVKEV